MNLKEIFSISILSLGFCAFAVAPPATSTEYYPWLLGNARGTVVPEGETRHISPNNDGVNDELVVLFQLRDDRYVKEWAFIVENEKGEVVKTIKNKDNRGADFKFKFFLASRLGITVPSFVSWNGFLDDGDIAPDGLYYYYFSVIDDNGHQSFMTRNAVVVDTSAPQITIKKYSDEEKVFGLGEKTTFVVEQSGSVEETWTACFLDASGNVVKRYKWNSDSPKKISWDGRTDDGPMIAEGVYSYRISATDNAGNTTTATIPNIVYSSDRPKISIALSSPKYFSPNDDGRQDSVEYSVKIPLPDSKTGNRLDFWELSVLDGNDSVVRTISGKSNPPAKIVFDGKDNSGKVLPDGMYYAVLQAKYVNGYKTPSAKAPVVILDNAKPELSSLSYSTLFNPDELGAFEIVHGSAVSNGSPISNWSSKIVNSETGAVVKEYDFGSTLPEKVEWDGLTPKRYIAPDGNYSYVLYAKDFAGNLGEFRGPEFKLDTMSTELLLALDSKAFNSKKSSLTLSPVIKSGHDVVQYEFSILDKDDGKEIWVQNGKKLPSSFKWNGTTSSGEPASDGPYEALLVTKSTNGAVSSVKSGTFFIDNFAPEIQISLDSELFSPDGDGIKDSLGFKVKSSSEKSWKGGIYDESNKQVRSYEFSGKIPDFEWDGTDDSGNPVPDGVYKVSFESRDDAGNFGKIEIPGITVDTAETKIFLLCEDDGFSPNGDGFKDSEIFTVRSSKKTGVKSWELNVLSNDGKIVRTLKNDQNSTVLPSKIEWDGTDEDGAVVEGKFFAKLNVVYDKGNVVEAKTTAFVSSVTLPKVGATVLSKSFSPDNDGENDDFIVNLSSAAKPKSWSFKVKDPNGKDSGKNSIAEKIVWDGKGNVGSSKGELVQSASEYSYEFSVTDELGLTSKIDGVVSVDVLLIKSGENLKMSVPSIIFRGNAADFGVEGELGPDGKIIGYGGITAEQRDNNKKVLKRVAEILERYDSCTVIIEGHAHNVSGTKIEEYEDTEKYGMALIPLSERRAEFVKQQLIEYGVKADRMTSVGRGGTMPVAPRNSADNWWKNRRVEFILHKDE